MPGAVHLGDEGTVPGAVRAGPEQDSGADQQDGEDSYRLDGSGLLDLEPALRDAVVLELPLSPLCEDGCQGLCVECGVRLADAEPGHGHEQRGTMWAALKDFRRRSRGKMHDRTGPYLRTRAARRR